MAMAMATACTTTLPPIRASATGVARLCGHRLRHLQLGRRLAATRRWRAPGPTRARLPDHAHGGVLPRDTPVRQLDTERLYGREAIAAYVDGIDGRLMRSMKSLLARRCSTRAPTSALAVRCVTAMSSPATCGSSSRWRRAKPARRSRAWYWAGRCSSSTTTASGTRARRPPWRARHMPWVLPRSTSSTNRSPPRSTMRAGPIESIVLVADIGGGTSDFSLVRVGPARRGRAERRDDILGQPRRAPRRHRLRPPGGTGKHPAPARLQVAAAAATGRIGARGAPRRVFRPRHLAPHQYRLCPGPVDSTARTKDLYAEPKHHAS